MSQTKASYTIESDNGLISIAFVGAFDEKITSQYARDIKQTVSELKGAPFKILIDGTRFEGAVPEAFAISNAVNEWFNSHNLIAKAIIHKSDIHMKITKMHEPNMNLQNIGEFDSFEAAFKWLASINR